jgi:putative intracellular protease/amidase
MAQTRILMVLTSNKRLGMYEGETGLWLSNFVAPFFAFENAGMTAEIATIAGGAPAIDPKSLNDSAHADAVKLFNEDERLKAGLDQAPALREVHISSYDAIVLPGGRGATWDHPASAELTVALEQFALQGKPIAAIGHGTAGLVPVMDKRSQPLTRGRQVACYSAAEEAADGFDRVVPFLIERKLGDLGAVIEPAAPGEARVAVDEFLITGQNAASAMPVAEALIEMIRGARIAA